MKEKLFRLKKGLQGIYFLECERNNKDSLFSFHTQKSWRPIKNYHSIGKKNRYLWHFVLLGKNVLFKESSPSTMVTRNPNWSTNILWYGTGYVKGKILSPLKCPA
jgi:hypothetical protein